MLLVVVLLNRLVLRRTNPRHLYLLLRGSDGTWSLVPKASPTEKSGEEEIITSGNWRAKRSSQGPTLCVTTTSLSQEV